MPKSLKLCYVADATNIHVQRWLRYFLDKGYQVSCLTDKHDKSRLELIAGATVINIPNRESLLAEGKKADKFAVLKARGKAIQQYVNENKPDLLHAIFLYQRGWSAAYANHQPLVVTLLGSDMYLPKKHYRNKSQYRRDEWLNAMTLRQCALITAVSEDLCNIANKLTRRKNLVEMLPIGIDPSLFKPGLDTSELREELDIPMDAFVILSPRQVTPLYNHETIIQALPKILTDIPNAVLVIKDAFGNTDDRQAYIQQLKTLVKSLKIEHAVRWAEEVPFLNLPYFYNMADVVISIPSTDGMPVTIFEAISCQKPLIVGDLPAYDNVILNGQTGLRVPLRNHQALANAVIKLQRNEDLVKRMVEESQLILHEYGIFDQQMHRMERYYHALKNKRMEKPKGFRNYWESFCFQLVTHFGM